LDGRRLKLEFNKGLSFPSISSVGGNAAIVHYKPEKDKAATMNPDLIYLIDSGG
jgi:Xaa-Pro aminopeptidase